jgi:hypothetical protein
MQAIIPNRPAHVRPYAWGRISVNPDPPRVGEVTRLTFPLANPGPGEVVVERIEVGIATFGMGMPWEQLDPIGPFHLAPDAEQVVEAVADWTPRLSGHRCVRAHIYVERMESPVLVGRNLDVIQADAHEGFWRVPFRVGNPERVRAPIVLRVDGQGDAELLQVALRVGGRPMRANRAMWLEPGEDVAAELHLIAEQGLALEAVRTVEAYIGDRLIDGIQVNVHRPALALPLEPRVYVPEREMVETTSLAV